MYQKELRLALVCYGGVSLAVYMHGVTKEIWHLAKASRNFHSSDASSLNLVAKVYQDFLARIEKHHDMRLRVLPDILTGASAGGINAIFLAQAIHSGHSLDPLTDLWLDKADVDELTDPDARPMWRYAKFWAQPIAEWILRRPGNAVSESVAPETRAEVRHKVSSLVRGRWFSPPFSGDKFSNLLYDAFEEMRASGSDVALLPPRHPIDLLVTATDFFGHTEMLRLNSPPVVVETEHRMPIGFRRLSGDPTEIGLADPLELVLAARATASFPGAFPPLTLAEIDRLAADRAHLWENRGTFLSRIMPVHVRDGTVDNAALIDGSVLVNAPFGSAIAALQGKPAQREVDRRFVYIDPRPDRISERERRAGKSVGFFGAIFGSISTLPREQPIRDNLERIEQQSRDAERLSRIVLGMKPEIDAAVEKLFGRTFFLDSPSPKRLVAWRKKAQMAAADRAGYAFQAYAQTKFSAIIDRLADITWRAAPELALPDPTSIAIALRQELERRGLDSLAGKNGGASDEAIEFFRSHDVGFRIRRLRLLARRLAKDWELDPEIPDDALDLAREKIFDILALYSEADSPIRLGHKFAGIAHKIHENPGAVLDHLERTRLLPETDAQAEELLCDALVLMPSNLRRRMLLTYLGFPFYDVATLPLLQNEGLTEYNVVKVDRISPDDARSIREGGAKATLKGIEFYNFGAFFSRSYRENDYIWGRLHGAERMIDLVASTVNGGMPAADVQKVKKDAFLAIIEEEMALKRCAHGLLEQIRSEVLSRMN